MSHANGTRNFENNNVVQITSTTTTTNSPNGEIDTVASTTIDVIAPPVQPTRHPRARRRACALCRRLFWASHPRIETCARCRVSAADRLALMQRLHAPAQPGSKRRG
jgi:hypothetical protein